MRTVSCQCVVYVVVFGSGICPGAADPIIIVGTSLGGLFSVGSGMTASTGIAIGAALNVTGDLAVGIGNAVSATAAGATAVGTGASATGVGGVALGQNARASADVSLAIGANAAASHVNSVAIGNGATTTRANQIVIGTSTSTYTLAGVSSSASVSALNGPTRLVISDGAGNLATTSIDATRLAGLDGRVGALETTTAALANDVAAIRKDVRRGFEGTAIALAVGGTTLPEGRRFAVSGNIGTFNGETAFGASAALRLTENMSLNGGLGAGFARGGVGGRGGMTYAW